MSPEEKKRFDMLERQKAEVNEEMRKKAEYMKSM
jgi:hypothetical protein